MGLNSLAGEGGDAVMDEYIISPPQQRGGAPERAGRNLEGSAVLRKEGRRTKERGGEERGGRKGGGEG